MSSKEESRQKILQAAFEAFAENGYEKTSMDDIVKSSGLSKGTLYWHFTNKRELFLATIQMPFQQFEMQLNALAEQEDTPAEDRLRILFAQVGEYMTVSKNMIGLLVDAFFQSYRSQDARDMMSQMYAVYIGAVEQIIRQGITRGEFRAVDPHMTAVVLMAGGDGVSIYMLLDPAWDVPTALNMMVEMVINNLKKETPDR
jgi:AcrR family transcriptional regulator